MKAMSVEGYKFKSKPLGNNLREYWLVKKTKPIASEEMRPSTNGHPSTVTLIKERLVDGQGLVAAEIAEDYHVSPNSLSVAIAQMTKEGYVFTYDSERTIGEDGKPRTVKRHHVVTKGEPPPPMERNSRKKSAGFRIPAPQVDVLTEVILVHRIDDGTVQVGLKQSGHQWLLEVRNYVE